MVNESLRLYPPAYVIGRETIEACEIGGFHVPAGTTVYMSPWVLHRDSRYFEAPEEFRPERWLDGLAGRLPRSAYVPFGGGPRLCIGQSFAMMEAILLLAAVSRRFRLTLDPNQPVEPFRRSRSGPPAASGCGLRSAEPQYRLRHARGSQGDSEPANREAFDLVSMSPTATVGPICMVRAY